MATVDETLVTALSRTMRALERPLTRHIAVEGLTPAQFGVLEVLLHKGPRTVNQIIEEVLSSSGNIGVVIDNLMSGGLIEKRLNPNDGRSRIISLTDDGEDKIRAYYPAHRNELRRLMSGVAHTDKKDLIKALSMLRRSLEKASS